MWHLKNIPKIAHFYWGGKKLSYLRFLSVQSFRQLNPDWTVRVHMPTKLSRAKPAWDSFQQKDIDLASDYTAQLKSLDVGIVYHDFGRYRFKNQAHEVHKSDFLRWRLLGQHGGLWSDIDILYTRPMDQLEENLPKNADIDAVLCPLNPPDKHTVGFLLSSANNKFFKHIAGLAKKEYNPNVYQCMGSDLINQRFKTFESFGEQFPTNQFMFLNRNCVYSITSKTIEMFYQSVDANISKKINNKSVIGFHWFAGHPRSQLFENALTADTVNEYDNLLSTVIKEYQHETCD
jgi:hypothetical protein